jgi:hypothetical protein
MVGAAAAGTAHVVFLSGIDHSHDLRTAAAVVVVWLLLAGGFATVFRMALSGKDRRAARRSMRVALHSCSSRRCGWLSAAPHLRAGRPLLHPLPTPVPCRASWPASVS